ncbi:hypothetical protein NL676_000076 [Syzygium grande]|nr:hypothetical protein NL676_000076 [Syzygium grande]
MAMPMGLGPDPTRHPRRRTLAGRDGPTPLKGYEYAKDETDSTAPPTGKAVVAALLRESVKDTDLHRSSPQHSIHFSSSPAHMAAVASQLLREWTGIQQFPAAAQTKLLELLGKLKQENVSTLTILVMGKGGVGKSSTVNSIIRERAVAVSAFQPETPRPVMVSRSRAGFALNVIDTPGSLKGDIFLMNKTIDILLYVDRLDTYRVDNLDKQIVKAVTESFGKDIWKRALVVLTHAQLSPPDGLEYDVFFTTRSEAPLKVVRSGAKMKKQNTWGDAIPVALVENSGRCKKNENNEKVLPCGAAWIPNLVRTIAEVALNGSKAILVNKKLIEGPNPNRSWKEFIPLIFAFQHFFIIKPLQWAIKNDMAREMRPAWEQRDAGLSSRKF